MAGDRSAAVRQDLIVAPMLLATGALMVLAEGAIGLWWVGAAVAAGTATLSALSDRSRRGVWLFAGVGVLAIGALLWWTWSRDPSIGPIGWFIAGLGVGSALNRVVFGVLRPVPEPRARRQGERSF